MKTYALVASMVLSGWSLQANTLTVTSLADSGPGSLRDAVAASALGDTINFAVTGTIFLNSSIQIPHTLNILGPGPAQLVVDAQRKDRVFITVGGDVVLSGMTITNGFIAGANGPDGTFPGQDGGPGLDAIGGGILDVATNLFLTNCWITGNVVRGGRGGAGADNPAGAAFKPGNGGQGGQGLGGALYATSTVFVARCTFSRNAAAGGAGGPGGTNDNPAVNEAGGTGGTGGGGQGAGVNEIDGGEHIFLNATFSGNLVGGGQGGPGGDSLGGVGGQGGNGGSAGGGGVATVIGTFSSDTIISNTAVGGFGGLGGNGTPNGPSGSQGGGTAGGVLGYIITCQSIVDNSIVADNFANGTYPNFFIDWVDDGYNFLGTDDQIICQVNGPGTQQGTINNPLHPQLGPLAQNGGGLPTHAVLLASPVLDAGNSFGTTFGVTNDERGAPRPYDFPLVPNLFGGDGSDIGAFELGSGQMGAIQDTNGVVVSWPAYYGDFALQSTTNLQGSNVWMDVPAAPTVVSNQMVVTNRITDVPTFYRLVNRPAQ